jgi:hypothetical protein
MACVVGLVVAVPAPPQAAFGTQPAWQKIPELAQGRYSGSNLVKFWQEIVQSDVDTGTSCTQFVDGAFGPNTKTRTVNWQSTFKIKADGAVGTQSWNTAQNHLRLNYTDYVDTVSGGWGGRYWTWYYSYVGKRTTFSVVFGAVERYENGAYVRTDYDPWQFHACGQAAWTSVSW